MVWIYHCTEKGLIQNSSELWVQIEAGSCTCNTWRIQVKNVDSKDSGKRIFVVKIEYQYTPWSELELRKLK